MRRATEENSGTYSTNVFSDEAWSNSKTPTYTASVELNDSADLSKYAATSLPDTFTSSSKTPRFTPSPHSPHYEPAPAQTNSEGNPFDHAAYDGRPASPLRQNAKYEDMPSPLRKRKLGGPVERLVSDQNTAVTPPQAPQVPQATVAPPAPQPAPRTQPAPQTYRPAPTKPVQEDVAYRPAPQTQPAPSSAAVPPAPQTQPAPPQKQTQQTQEVNETVENEIPLSDFEKDFIEERVEATTQEKVIDLTKDTVKSRATPIPPSIFNTGPVDLVDPALYGANDSVFGTQHLDIPDSDRLYKDSKPQRETFQIDLDLIKNLFAKITIKMAIITLAVVLLLTAAFLVLKPASSSNQNIPANSSEAGFNGSEKLVVPSTGPDAVAPDPSVTLPDAQPGEPVYIDPEDGSNIFPTESGAVVTYDENGNAIYSSPTNQNFNGE